MEWLHHTFIAPFNHVHEQTFLFLDKTLGGNPDSLFVPFLSCVVMALMLTLPLMIIAVIFRDDLDRMLTPETTAQKLITIKVRQPDEDVFCEVAVPASADMTALSQAILAKFGRASTTGAAWRLEKLMGAAVDAKGQVKVSEGCELVVTFSQRT